MQFRSINAFFSTVVCLLASGCGVYTPLLETNAQPHVTAFLVNRIVGHVQCELGRAILDRIANDKLIAGQNHTKRKIAWLDDFAGTLTLTMTVDEKSSINPGLNYITPISSTQTFNLGLGASGAAEATRKQQVDYVFNIKQDFLDNTFFRANNESKTRGPCESGDDVLIEGDLQIGDWLDSVLFPYNLPQYNLSKPPDVLTDDITFVLTFNGNITPTWKLVRFSVNPNAPFLSATRARTNEALIALGPVKTEDKGKKTGSKGPSQTVLDFRNITLIGSAVNLAIRNP